MSRGYLLDFTPSEKCCFLLQLMLLLKLGIFSPCIDCFEPLLVILSFLFLFQNLLTRSEPLFSSPTLHLHLFLTQIFEQDVQLVLSLADFLFPSFISPPSSSAGLSVLQAWEGDKDDIRQVWCSPYSYFTKATQTFCLKSKRSNVNVKRTRERWNGIISPQDLNNCKKFNLSVS